MTNPVHTLVRTRSSSADTEVGAVAVMVALLSVVLFVLAAFAVDIGNSFAVKRQLSVAADAAALAAAQDLNKLLPFGKGCYSPDLTPTASATATKVNSQNDATGRSSITTVVNCTTHGIEVTVTNARTVNTIFGGVIGVSTITPSTSATAILQVPVAVSGGLRPVAACFDNVKTGFDFDSYFLAFASRDGGACGTTAKGQWGIVNFLDQGSDTGLIGTSSSAYGTAFQSGTPAFFDPGYKTPIPPSTNNLCNAGSVSTGSAGCQSEWLVRGYAGPFFSPNTIVSGNANSGLGNNSGWVASTRSEFTGMIGQTIQLPVVTGLDRSIGRYDVVGVVTAFVCNATWGGSTETPDSSCAPSTPPDWTGGGQVDLTSNTAILWLKPVKFFLVSGTFGGSSCQIGDVTCDFGTRSVALYK